ncbi:START domain-containing protein [Isoalcanivorax beigongshangi]|uniref:START domain-containing protein n=1 Tax=Isoalcanivorax beigongshangi TaxID=3238810 RepID=A0ABV4AHX0_9GAMM
MMRCAALSLFLTLLLPLPVAAQAADGDWQLASLRDGIEVHVRQRPDSALKAFRGVTRFQLDDPYTLVAALNDYPHYPRWLHYVDAAEEFQRSSPLERQLRLVVRLPWPLQHREAILRATVTQEQPPPLARVTVALESDNSLYPAQSGFVRFPMMRGVLTLQLLGAQQVEMTYQLELDPGGRVPSWLANLALANAPYYTLLRLQRTLSRPEYADAGADIPYLQLRSAPEPP